VHDAEFSFYFSSQVLFTGGPQNSPQPQRISSNLSEIARMVNPKNNQAIKSDGVKKNPLKSERIGYF